MECVLNASGLEVKTTNPYDIICWGLNGQPKDVVLLVRNISLMETINRTCPAGYNIRIYQTRQVHGGPDPVTMRDLCRIVFETATGVAVRP